VSATLSTDSFDPALPGTDNARWNELLAHRAAWTPTPGPLLVVSPHPDDEVLGAGGLIRSCSQLGHPVTIVSVTDGEGAFSDWPELKMVRRRELEIALLMLTSEPVRVVRLSLGDGNVSGLMPALYESIDALSSHRPTIVAPFERDGHPDHDAVGAVCLQVARQYDLSIVRYPIWTWHHGSPAQFDQMPWVRLPLDEVAQVAKRTAIQCFASQLAPPGGRAPILPAHVLDYFHRDYEAFLL
jgi:LmbE family N-acetylglucosaminyl deacetylase